MTPQATRAIHALESTLQSVGPTTYYSEGPENFLQADALVSELVQAGSQDALYLQTICQEILRHIHGVSLLEVLLPRVIASGRIDSLALCAGAPELVDYLDE